MRRLVILGLLLCAPCAHAYPFYAPRPIPNAIAGPTDPHVAAIFFNPAALGPLRGLHVHVEGSARVHEGSIDRAGGAGSAGINWTDFDAFAGLSWDVQTDAFTVGLAVYTPTSDLTDFGDSPVRYHAMFNRAYMFEQSAAAAFKISNRFYLGAGANFAEQWLDYKLARDAALAGGSSLVTEPNSFCAGAPCGFENPQARQVMRLRGFNWGIGFSVGVLARPIDRLWLGLSYVSHVFNTGRGGDFPLGDTQRPRLQPAPGQPQVCSDALPCNDLITVALPDMIYFGLRVEVNTKLDLAGGVRWIHYGTRQNLDVSFQGGDLAHLQGDPRASVPPQFYLDRGFQDAWAFEVSARARIGDTLRLAPAVVVETAAVDPGAVNAASIDAPKIDVSLTAEWHPSRHVLLGAHVGGTAYVLSDAGQRFSPEAAVACADARGALEACGAYNHGDALPSAAGRYTYYLIHAGLAMGLDF